MGVASTGCLPSVRRAARPSL